MTTCLLVRHGRHSMGEDRIVGRTPGVHLSAAGREEADRLTARLAATRIDAVYSSPRERARQTAEPLAAAHLLSVELSEAFDELDYGDWTGASFAELAADQRWREWNQARSRTRVPNGECMAEVQARAVAELELVASRHQAGVILVVSHSDVLKAVLLHFLGIPTDLLLRLEIGMGSLSVLELTSDAPPIVRCVNDVSHLGPSALLG